MNQPKIEVGYGNAQGSDSFAAGNNAASQALSMIHTNPVVAVMVFASVHYDLTQVLRGIKNIVPDSPLFGCSTAGEICNEPLNGSVVVTVLASSYMKVSCGLGRDVSRDWQSALDDTINTPGINSYFHDVKHWQQLTLKGKSTFSILFSPGNTRNNTSQSYEILEAIKLKSLGRLPVFGGSAADDWQMENNFVFCGDGAFPDSMVLAVFETQLQFGIAMDHGFIPTTHKTTVTCAEGHEVLELDGSPAADVYARIIGSAREELEHKHLTLTTGHTMGVSDPMGQFSINVASFFTPKGGINFTQPVAASTVLTLMEPDPGNMLQAGKEALRKAIMRGGITSPVLSLVAYCALIPKIIGNLSTEVIQNMAEMNTGSPLVGFCSFGEQGMADSGSIQHNNSVISTLVLGSDLTPIASVALENEKLQREQEQQTRTLSKINRELLTEISERKRAEKALQRERDFSSNIISKTPTIICGITPGGTTTFINAAGERITGFSSEEIIDKNWWQILYAGDEYLQVEELFRLFKQGDVHDYEMSLTTRSGEKRIISWNSLNIVNDSGEIEEIIGIGIDITERQTNEAALRKSEEHYRSLFSSLQESFCLFDIIFSVDGFPEDYRFIEVNPAFESLTGMGRDRIIGRTIREISPGIEECWLTHFSCVAESGVPATLESYSTGFRGFLEVYTYRPAAGQIAAIITDATEKKVIRDDRERNQRLESLGVLAGGIAHDFNNILTAAIGNISIARMQAGDGHKAATSLAASEKALVRATDLTRQLLTFARGGEPIKKIIEIGHLLKETATFASHGSFVKCHINLADDLLFVEADEGQLSQVIHNLVINAVQAMPEGGTVTLGAENIDSLQEGKNFVQISVADTGVGIPENHLHRIFDPYFTTKQQGSGLGLAACYSIIKKHGGTITVSSTLGRGSTFYVNLPALEQGFAFEPVFIEEVVHGSGRILVMDDEEPVRDVAQAMLEGLGYVVECTDDGATAIDLYRQRKEEGNPFFAVIMDLTIPGGIGGKEAITSLIQIDPDVKAVVSSGYDSDPVMANYREYGFKSVLSKPYLLHEMSKALQDLI